MKSPLISIIVNCYNGEKYLENCLNSILSQTYKNFELIFWDNCSIDKSKSIFMKKKDHRFKYFNDNKHTNLYNARNKALKHVTGDYITFLDVDDTWYPEKLMKQISIMRTNNDIGFCYSGFKVLREKEGTLRSAYNNQLLKSGYISKNLLRKYNVGILTLMVRKSLIDNKIYFDNRFTIMGDLDFVLRISKLSKGFAIKDDLGIYRMHNDNLSHDLNLTINERLTWEKENLEKSLFNYFEIKPFIRETKYLKLLYLLQKNSIYKSILLLANLRGIILLKGILAISRKIINKITKFIKNNIYIDK